MRSIFVLFIALKVVSGVYVDTIGFPAKCMIGEDIYDPSKSEEVPWFEVNLDLPPKERFKSVVLPFKDKIQAVFDVLSDFFTIIPGIPVWDMAGEMMLAAFENGKIQQPYMDEIQGIADVTGVNLGQLAFLNIFYELSRFCTSIIAQTPGNVDIYHARNLDFGQLFVWDVPSQSWGLSNSLKAVTVNLNYTRNGKTLFYATTLAGHVGILTGMMPGQFTLSMNAKVEPDLNNVIQWFNGNITNIEFAMFFDRRIFEVATNYEEARQMIMKVPLLSGAYFILGGNSPGQGAVIVRNVTSVQFERKLYDGDNDWFLLQTNYDPDKQPLYLDDRRDPGNKCMKIMGQANVSESNLYKVLTSKPNLNKTTVHTVIMSVSKGIYKTFIQYCPNPCWAF